ncbi:hypothetical protein LTR05_000439 [Lithohypha guttulata]|uniref:Uncharacterized protein n=1 Tax=Lithohypha guttulata TaxID=1690604 RepID=A0AAN7T4H9_9EURO|nr:hypothetical protein LTR05_000439 [Lithohypha guttulata]
MTAGRTRFMATSTILGCRRTYKILTVSRYPDKATLMVKRLAEKMNDKYTLIHVANCERVEEVSFRVRDLQPDMLVWSSTWTPEQVDAICDIARKLDPNVDLCGLPEEMPSQKSVDVILARMKTKGLSAANSVPGTPVSAGMSAQ